MPDLPNETTPKGGPPFTYEHYLLFPEDGLRHEIIEGEHYVTASPRLVHQRLVGRLHLEFARAVAEDDLGEVFLSPTDVLFSNINVVVPDLLYVSHERAEVLTELNVQGAPDLVVEVLSPSTRRRDERLKRDLYQKFGVEEYWIGDPELETVKVYRAEGERFGEPELYEREAEGVVATPLLPALSLELATLFRPPGSSR